MKKNFSGGLQWKKGCFHIHTPASEDYGLKSINKILEETQEERKKRLKEMKQIYDENRKISPKKFLQMFIERGYQFIVVTDHHSFTWIKKLNNALEKIREDIPDLDFTIFPGIEISTNEYHVDIVFDPETSEEKLNDLIIKLQFKDIQGKSKNLPWNSRMKEYEKIWEDIFKIRDYMKKDKSLNYVFIFPHIRLSTGVHTLAAEARKKIYQSIRGIYGILPKNLAKVSENAIKNEMGLKIVPLIKTSDYHGLDDNNIVPTWIRFETMSIQSLRQCIYDPESRISLEPPPEINYPYIESLSCPGTYFGDIDLNFSPHINTFIGGRGSGKSALLELIFFVFKKIDFMWKSENPLKKEMAIRILTKINNLIKRDSQVSANLANINPDYPFMEISRKFKYIKIDSGENLDNTQIIEILEEPVECSYNDSIIPWTKLQEIIPDPCEMYFQDEFQCVTNELNYPLNILDLYLENFTKFKVSELKIEIGNLEKEIKEKHIKLKNLYIGEKKNILVIENEFYDKKIEEQEIELLKLESQLKEKSTDEELEKQKEHETWTQILERKNHNDAIIRFTRENIKNLEEILSKVQKDQFLLENEFSSEEKALSITEQITEKWKVLQEYLNDYVLKVSTFKKNIDNINQKIEEVSNSLGSIWDLKYKNHEQEYEEFQKISKERSQLHDNINKLKSQIKKTKKEQKNNLERIQEISELEYEINQRLLDLHQKWEEYIKRRENAINHLNFKLPREQYHHLHFEFKYYWNYLEILQNNTDRIREKDLKKLCKNFTGQQFITLLEKQKASDLFKKFEKLGLTEKTRKKILQLYSHEEIPNSLRGLFDEKLLNIERSGLKEEIIIKIIKDEKSDSLSKITMVSPGEQHRNLLLLAFISKKIPLLIDQPEDHLDFQIKNSLPDLLRSQRFNRQFLIITHFQNIPVIADTEKIFFLKEEYNINTQEMNTDIINGAFESMVRYIIKLEGGPEAILQRKNRYAEFVKVLKE